MSEYMIDPPGPSDDEPCSEHGGRAADCRECERELEAARKRWAASIEERDAVAARGGVVHLRERGDLAACHPRVTGNRRGSLLSENIEHVTCKKCNRMVACKKNIPRRGRRKFVMGLMLERAREYVGGADPGTRLSVTDFLDWSDMGSIFSGDGFAIVANALRAELENYEVSCRSCDGSGCDACSEGERTRPTLLESTRTSRSEYWIWSAMIQRCTNPNRKKYELYGGRGIRVCDRWLTNFDAFYSDMGPRPSLLHTIDRINNDGNYEPNNCRWATKKEQMSNRSRSVYVELNGVRKTVDQWETETGISRYTIYGRIKRGWPPDKVLARERFTTKRRAA